MTWVRLDDAFYMHRKVLAVGGDAGWLHVCALCWSSQNLTDGFIPAHVLERLSDRRKPLALVDRLIREGMWRDEGDGWRIHDFLAFQRSKEQVEKERARWRGYKRDSTAESTLESNADSAPSRPVPSRRANKFSLEPNVVNINFGEKSG